MASEILYGMDDELSISCFGNLALMKRSSISEPGHTKLGSTVRYLGIEVDVALEIAEQSEI